MQKKNKKISQHQRQKLSRKMILILGASFMGCMIAALTIFLKTSRVDESIASGNTFMVSDEPPTTEMTLDAPVIKTLPALGPNTLFVRAVKNEQKNSVDNNH